MPSFLLFTNIPGVRGLAPAYNRVRGLAPADARGRYDR